MSETAIRNLPASARSKKAVSEHAQEHAPCFSTGVLDTKPPKSRFGTEQESVASGGHWTNLLKRWIQSYFLFLNREPPDRPWFPPCEIPRPAALNPLPVLEVLRSAPRFLAPKRLPKLPRCPRRFPPCLPKCLGGGLAAEPVAFCAALLWSECAITGIGWRINFSIDRTKPRSSAQHRE